MVNIRKTMSIGIYSEFKIQFYIDLICKDKIANLSSCLFFREV